MTKGTYSGQRTLHTLYLDMSQDLNYSGECQDWNEVSHAEMYFPEISKFKSAAIMSILAKYILR